MTEQQQEIAKKIVDSNFKGVNFAITPQVFLEIEKRQKFKKDRGIFKFLQNICKVKMSSTDIGKYKHAELIYELMKDYLDRYSFKADNWSTCDLLKFDVRNKEEKFLGKYFLAF